MTVTHSSTLAAEVPEFAQLQRQIHHALLAQNPEWILANGESPTCDSYDARFAQLLRQSIIGRGDRAEEEAKRTKLVMPGGLTNELPQMLLSRTYGTFPRRG